MNIDDVVPLPDGWLQQIAARHGYAMVQMKYEFTLRWLARHGHPHVDNECVLLVLEDSVAIMQSPEGYEHGMRMPSATICCSPIVRLDPYGD